MSHSNLNPEYLSAQKEGVPVKEVLMIAGAIAYFVLPVDLIPDIVPGFGYTDDLAALTTAFKAAHKIFTKVAKDKALGKAAEIFGDKFNAESAANIVNGKIQEHKGGKE